MGRLHHQGQAARGVQVVTGAGNGIGRALALELASRGHDLALVDCVAGDLAATVESCRLIGVQARGWVIDVADESAVSGLGAEIRSNVGPPGALYNVAGVMHVGRVAESSVGDLSRVIEVNLVGTMACTRELLPHVLVAPRPARIVMVSSAFGLVGVPGYSAYVASKYGVLGFAEALRQEVGYRPRMVTVTCAFVGGVDTDIMTRATYSHPEEAPSVQARFALKVARISPEAAARAILAGAFAGRPDFSVGADARLFRLLSRGPQPLVRLLTHQRFGPKEAGRSDSGE